MTVPFDLMTAIAALRLVAEGGLDPWVRTSRGWFVRDASGMLVAAEARESGSEPVVISAFTEEHLMHAIRITGASDDAGLLDACEAEALALFGQTARVSRTRPGRLDIAVVEP